MYELLSFIEEAILTDIQDNIIDKNSIRIVKQFFKEIYIVEFNHSYKNQNDFDIGLGDFFHRLKSYGCQFQIKYTDNNVYITISIKQTNW